VGKLSIFRKTVEENGSVPSTGIPSLRNKLFLIGVGLSVSGILLYLLVFPLLYRFISSVPKRPDAQILVVQGWVFNFIIEMAVDEFQRGNYRAVIVTGNDIEAVRAGKKLINKGVPVGLVIVVPYNNNVVSQCTFHEAFSVKDELKRNFPEVTVINVVTSSVHSKKTVTAFKKVLGKKVEVGIVANKSIYGKSNHRLMSKGMIRLTARFFIGYVYALLWSPEWVKPGL